MTVHRLKSPTWAIRNLILLLAPVVTGLLGFPLFRIWFIPAPSLRLYAFVFVIAYYIVVIQLCQRSSGKKMWASFRRSSPNIKEYVGLIVGLALFFLPAYMAFSIVGPAFITSITGRSVTKEFTVSSVDSINPSGSCGTEVRLVEVSPVLSRGFCLNSAQANVQWVSGSRVILSGKESMLGLRVTSFGL